MFGLPLGLCVQGHIGPEFTYRIYHSDDKVCTVCISTLDSSVDKVRGGVFFIVYQTKLGLAMIGSVTFYYDWDGVTSNIARIEAIDIKPQLLNEYSIENLRKFFKIAANSFLTKLDKWDDIRQKDVSTYIEQVRRTNC